MQLSDREIQNTLDLLKKSRSLEEDEQALTRPDEIEGIDDVVKRIGGEPEVRKEKVERLRQALQTSSYDVTGDEVAKKLIGRIFSDKIR